MARAFDESHAAYASGDGARAHELSEQGKRHQHDMERLNGEASQWIFVSEWSLSLFVYRMYTDWTLLAENNEVPTVVSVLFICSRKFGRIANLVRWTCTACTSRRPCPTPTALLWMRRLVVTQRFISSSAKACIRRGMSQRSSPPSRTSCASSYPLLSRFSLFSKRMFLRHNLAAGLDPHNAGVLIVNLQGQPVNGARGMNVDDITRTLENDNQSCVVM
jgi:hypothetical protein